MKRNYMAAVALLAIVSCTAVSCGSGTSKQGQSAPAAHATANSTVLEVDSLLKNAETLAGQPVVVEGVCTHICQHGGGKIFLMGSDDTQTVRVESGELGSFDPQCVNRIVRVTGTLDEQRVDEAYLAAWEEQTKAQTGERHGTTEAGCDAEKAARQETGATVAERIADFRAKIAARKAAEGKDYLSFYYVTATSYEIEQ